MSLLNYPLVDYGFTNPLQKIFNPPIVSKRVPTTADKAPIGQLWVQPVDSSGTAQNMAWILTSIINNSATWILLESGGGAGVFSSLTVTPGPISLTGTTTVNSTGAANTSIGTGSNTGTVTIGNSAGASALNLVAGTGNFTLDGAAATTYTIGASAVAGTITIGGSAQTGDFILAPSSAAVTVDLANNDGAKAINIGNGVDGNTIMIGSGANTSAQIMGIGNGAAGADNTVSILSGVATAGTQTLNLGAGDSAKTINIGTGIAVINNINIGGTGANVIAIGNTQTGGSIDIGNALTTGSIQIGSATSGLVAVPALVSTAQTTLTPTLDANVGSVLVDGTDVTTKITAGSSLTFAITNNVVTALSQVLVSVSSTEAIASVQLSVTAVQIAINTISVIIKNNGGSDTGGNYNINFWVLK